MNIEKRVKAKIVELNEACEERVLCDYGRCPDKPDIMVEIVQEIVILEAKCDNLMKLVNSIGLPK